MTAFAHRVLSSLLGLGLLTLGACSDADDATLAADSSEEATTDVGAAGVPAAVSREAQVAIIEQRLDATNRRDWDTWESLHTPDAVRTAPELEEPLQGAAAMRAAIEPGKTDCNLCTQIGDGSMPQDADPLTKDQIALVNKWVQLGAQVDAGVEPTSALIRIMPKFAQPPAPEAYKVPIPVTAVAISPDGKLLASGGYHEVILWNIPDGTVARRIGNVAERVHQLIFSADGQRIVLAHLAALPSPGRHVTSKRRRRDRRAGLGRRTHGHSALAAVRDHRARIFRYRPQHHGTWRSRDCLG